jgi:hypothetical protein
MIVVALLHEVRKVNGFWVKRRLPGHGYYADKKKMVAGENGYGIKHPGLLIRLLYL